MNMSELAADPQLRLEVVAAGEGSAATAPITWCAVTELMDPTPHLSAGAAVLTTGMGLAFTDPRTWDAYVERLRAVHVSGVVFGLGPAHRRIPEGLAAACRAQGLTLLALPQETPLLQVSRRVTDALAADRMRELAAGWELADACTRMVAQGAGLAGILERIAREVGGEVGVVDETHAVLESAAAPEGSRPREGEGTTSAGRTYLRLPADAGDARFRLVVTGMRPGVLVQPRLGPVAAVIGMVLSSTLTSVRPLHSDEAARFIGALDGRVVLDEAVLAGRAADAGFDPAGAWGLIRLSAGEGVGQARLRAVMWRVRTALGARLGPTRVHERVGEAVLVTQPRPASSAEPGAADAALADAVQVLLRGADGVVADVLTVDSLDELVLASRVRLHGRPATGATRVRVLPPLDLAAVVAGIPRRGMEALAGRLLAPVEKAGADLLRTLEVWLRHSGRTSPVCAELFIHRNTLAHRLRVVEQALGMDLGDGDVRALCSMALAIRRGAV